MVGKIFKDKKIVFIMSFAPANFDEFSQFNSNVTTSSQSQQSSGLVSLQFDKGGYERALQQYNQRVRSQSQAKRNGMVTNCQFHQPPRKEDFFRY